MKREAIKFDKRNTMVVLKFAYMRDPSIKMCPKTTEKGNNDCSEVKTSLRSPKGMNSRGKCRIDVS